MLVVTLRLLQSRHHALGGLGDLLGPVFPAILERPAGLIDRMAAELVGRRVLELVVGAADALRSIGQVVDEHTHLLYLQQVSVHVPSA